MDRKKLAHERLRYPLLPAWTARDAEDKTGGDRKIRHGHYSVAGRKFVFNTAEPCPNALVLSACPPHGNDTRGRSFYFQEHV